MDLLSIKNLCTYFHTDEGVVKAVDGVSFHLGEGETLGLVGESGCGKSVCSLSILGLIVNPGKIESGEIYFKGENLLEYSERKMRQIRGNQISMIFQEPMTSLNPVYTVGEQICEALRLHREMGKKSALDKAVEMLQAVSIPSPEQRVREYPHQLSGGMRQRVMIAMALACEPSLLIADEPTTALDVTVQAQILDLLAKLKTEFNLALLLITHDLGVIAEVADRVAVMYTGKIVEEGPCQAIFDRPLHPYTVGLMRSIPRIDPKGGKQKLSTIEGVVPHPQHLPPGCYFEPRCPKRMGICRQDFPGETEIEPGHKVKCYLYNNGKN